MKSQGPWFSFMLRAGPVMLNNYGLFVRRKVWSANGKVPMTDYFCVFTGKREHVKRMERVRK